MIEISWWHSLKRSSPCCISETTAAPAVDLICIAMNNHDLICYYDPDAIDAIRNKDAGREGYIWIIQRDVLVVVWWRTKIIAWCSVWAVNNCCGCKCGLLPQFMQNNHFESSISDWWWMSNWFPIVVRFMAVGYRLMPSIRVLIMWFNGGVNWLNQIRIGQTYDYTG